MAKAAPSQMEKASLFALLGAAYDKSLAQAALDLALTEEPGVTNSAAIISRVSARHPDSAVDFALAHLRQVERLVDLPSRSRYIARLAAGSRDPSMPAKLEAYAQQHLKPDARKPIEESVARMREGIATRSRIAPAVAAWFARNRR